MTQPNLVNLHPNQYSLEFHCYPFAVKLDVLEVATFLILLITLIKYVL